MANTSIVIIDAESNRYTLRVALEQRYDMTVSHAPDITVGLECVRSSSPDYILLNPASVGSEATGFLMQLAQLGNSTPVIVAGDDQAVNDLRSVYPYIVGRIPSIYSERDLLPILHQQHEPQTGGAKKRGLADRAALVRTNQLLERRVQEVMTLHQIGKAVASLTDLDAILARIVESAVYLLQAEESSIMLLDSGTNELYLRAQKGLGEKHARGFNLRIEDTLIGSVVQTGRPVILEGGPSKEMQLKVVTGYFVNALLYVPLTLRGQVMGVLGVANQTAQRGFEMHDQRLMEVLADYATLAIEVAQQHKALQRMHQDLSAAYTIATTVQELRDRLASNEPDIVSGLASIEDAAHVLIRLSEAEARLDV